jgi:hypothetical protein
MDPNIFPFSSSPLIRTRRRVITVKQPDAGYSGLHMRRSSGFSLRPPNSALGETRAVNDQ